VATASLLLTLFKVLFNFVLDAFETGRRAVLDALGVVKKTVADVQKLEGLEPRPRPESITKLRVRGPRKNE